MNRYTFGAASEAQLATIDDRLSDVLRLALSWGVMDFSVYKGHRTIEEQQEVFRQGKSQIDGINKKGKHNYYPSQAADILPYPSIINGVNVWNDKDRFCKLAGLIFGAAAVLDYEIRWGGDWDGDGNNADSTFNDYPHFEIIGQKT
jgi:peptidoglycan L-alanyl-D-glutamate endopeptidase CwlK